MDYQDKLSDKSYYYYLRGSLNRDKYEQIYEENIYSLYINPHLSS